MKTTAEQTHTFLYDGWNLIREDLGAATPSSRFYVWGLDLSGSLQGAGGVGGLLCWIEGRDGSPSRPFFPAYDANGNVSEYTDTNGAIVAHYEYDAFGNEIFRRGAEAQSHPFRFSTKYTDDESGLVYYGYRFYHPELGRWINRDPIEERGGVNLYIHVSNRSLCQVDYLGLKSVKIPISGGITIGFPGGFTDGAVLCKPLPGGHSNCADDDTNDEVTFEIDTTLTVGIEPIGVGGSITLNIKRSVTISVPPCKRKYLELCVQVGLAPGFPPIEIKDWWTASKSVCAKCENCNCKECDDEK